MTSSPSSAGGPGFAGHVVSFAGKLASIGRREAQALIQALGGEPSDDVTSRTTMLVVGDSAAREDDSSKLRRAEQVNAKAPEQIRIISEANSAGWPALRPATRCGARTTAYATSAACIRASPKNICGIWRGGG